MNDKELPKIPEYFSVKEAAELLHTNEKMIYYYVEHDQLKAYRAANLILIPKNEIENFRRKAPGRKRTTVPVWRISRDENVLLITRILVNIRPDRHDELLKKFERIRNSKEQEHNFPGTVARYVIGREQEPDTLEILLIWKQGIMPAEDEREQALTAFSDTLADVLDWASARYSHDKVYMHT